MSKKQEDNRDIFDKVADYLAPVAGAAVGARLGPRLIGGVSKHEMGRHLRDAERMRAGSRSARSRRNPTWDDADEAYGLDRASDRAYNEYGAAYRSRSRGAIAGAVAGGAAGHIGGQEAKKRRK